MTLSIVGIWIDAYSPWEFVGVFSTYEKALAACESESYFIGPATLDQAVTDRSVQWPGATYPLSKEPAKKQMFP